MNNVLQKKTTADALKIPKGIKNIQKVIIPNNRSPI
jgi:hypothetical protein